MKLSGEALAGDGLSGLDAHVLRLVAHEVKSVTVHGVQVAIVVGGGNIIRGADVSARLGIDEVTAHHMGMLATAVNALALQDMMEKEGLTTRVQTAIEMHQIAEPFIRRRAMRHLEKGRVVIFAGGTGNPYFSTDTAAALRAMEIGAEVIMKGTKVDGIYEADPVTHPTAKMFAELPFLSILNKHLKVMDSTAITLCMDNNLPLIVFNLKEPGNLKRIVQGDKIGTLVTAAS